VILTFDDSGLVSLIMDPIELDELAWELLGVASAKAKPGQEAEMHRWETTAHLLAAAAAIGRAEQGDSVWVNDFRNPGARAKGRRRARAKECAS
jgi:hypothetical protein